MRREPYAARVLTLMPGSRERYLFGAPQLAQLVWGRFPTAAANAPHDPLFYKNVLTLPLSYPLAPLTAQ